MEQSRCLDKLCSVFKPTCWGHFSEFYLSDSITHVISKLPQRSRCERLGSTILDMKISSNLSVFDIPQNSIKHCNIFGHHVPYHSTGDGRRATGVFWNVHYKTYRMIETLKRPRHHFWAKRCLIGGKLTTRWAKEYKKR